MTETANTLAHFLQWLRERHDAVMACEQEAVTSLLEAGDKETHKNKMTEKAQLLESMSADAKDLLAPLPGELRFAILATLEQFSASARMGLKLHSLFYMSALLHNDNSQKDDPDNLALFINKLTSAGENFSLER